MNKLQLHKKAHRLVALAASLVVMFMLVINDSRTTTVLAAEAEDSAMAAMTAVYAYELRRADVSDAAELVAVLSESAGTSAADWTFLDVVASNSLLGLGLTAEHYDAYAHALTVHVNSTETLSATDLERIALVYATLGLEPEWCAKVVNASYGSNGIMSRIYGLRLYSLCMGETTVGGTTQTTAYKEQFEANCLYSKDTLARGLTALQQENGGFGLQDGSTDVDVTAMAVRALSATEETACVQQALHYLSGMQQENALYASYGQVNAESTAQVWMALIHCGDSLTEDARFVSGEKTILQALLDFQNADGGFAHTMEGTSNALATIQVWEALALTCESRKGAAADTGLLPSRLTVDGIREQMITTIHAQTGSGIRLILVAALVVLFFLTCVYWICTGVKKPQRYLAGFGVTAVLIAVLFFLRVETPSEYRERVEQSQGSVATTIEIRGYDATILATTTVCIHEEDTVYDQLLLATGLYAIPMNYSGSTLFSNIYIRQIGDLAEFDYGTTSGWMYSVNGEMPQVGCSAYTLKEGDVVVWSYTTGEEDVQ